MTSFNYDELDAFILRQLLNNPDKHYSQIAKEFGVSVGTISVRLDKMREAGIIERIKFKINPDKLGFGVVCFIGITLNHAHSYPEVIKSLKEIPEVVEAYYTTGQYSIFCKVMVDSIRTLHTILSQHIQTITEIQSTDTLISLDTSIDRSIDFYRSLSLRHPEKMTFKGKPKL